MKKMNLWSKIFWALVFANLMFAIVRALLPPYPSLEYKPPFVIPQQEQNANEKKK